MAKTLWLVVAVVIGEVLILLRTVVPSEFEQAFTIGGGTISSNGLRIRVCEEVEVEFVVWILVLAHNAHAEHLLVKLERLLWILDSNHGVVLSNVSKESICSNRIDQVSVTIR